MVPKQIWSCLKLLLDRNKFTGAMFLCAILVAVCVCQCHALARHGATQDVTRARRLFNRFMFSGIVEDVATVARISQSKLMPQWDGSLAEGVELTIRSDVAVKDAYIGCSIAVNGVCLTATSIDNSLFSVGVSPETLRRTNLGQLLSGSPVNVERALRADGRNSGHFVQGHVDGTGVIAQRWQEGDSLWIKVHVPSAAPTAVPSSSAVKPDAGSDPAPGNAAGAVHESTAIDILRYIVPKGFIAVDGTSLTVCDVHRNDAQSVRNTGLAGWFTVMLVAHTQQNVIFPRKQVGDLVNIEVDIIGKLVEQSVSASIASLKGEVQQLAAASVQREGRIKDLEKRVRELEQNNAHVNVQLSPDRLV